MESSTKFQLANYYRDLQSIQKNLSYKNNDKKKIQKSKTPLQIKIQLPIKGVRQSIYQSKDQAKNKKLTLDKRKFQQANNIRSVKEIPLKYLEDIEQSYINKKFTLDNSSATKYQNQKIILEIKDFHQQKDLEKNKDEDKCLEKGLKLKHQLKKHSRRLQNPQKSINQEKKGKVLLNNKVQNRRTQSQTLTDALIEVLRHRNSIYEIVKRNCQSNGEDYGAQFQKIWQKSILYKKLVERINLLLKEP